jgi:hypothetical protein
MMKTYLTVLLNLACVLVFTGCKNPPVKSKLRGSWHSKDKKTGLKITAKEFILNEGQEPIAENYFVKGDTIFTSYEGTEPFTKFVIKNLTDSSLTLIYPDSTSVMFGR